MEKKHIVLTGFMGAGKTRIGKILANTLQFPLVDTDKSIEKETGMTIKDIFSQKGEEWFREQERRVVHRFCTSPVVSVISLGGGALQDKKTFQLVHRTGIVVYLKSSPEAIFERVKHTNKRPLLDVGDGEDRDQKLKQRIKELLSRREPVYMQADIIIERDNLEAETVASRILEEVKRFWEETHA